MESEVQLSGGLATAGAVIPSGDDVLRPSNPHTTSMARPEVAAAMCSR
ncbi:MAG: hypothetical protein AB7L17_18960 [Ilumatobacteraceae bacterium]